MFHEYDNYDCPDGMGTCSNCSDHCLEWVDSHNQQNVLRCPVCGYTEEWVEPDVPLEIVLPKYQE